jgi:membrane-bound serine protease (ClpP class)
MKMTTACLAILLISCAVHGGTVEWLVIDGAIGPVSGKMIHEALLRAESEQAQALVIELDTPGGLLSTTRTICKDFLATTVPVVVYVSPAGARAGSAGVFLTLAANVAVMARGTNIGAAHPVGIGGIGGADTTRIMAEKVTNDAAAFARTLAQRHHRNENWAERAVRESISATENEAIDLGVIDFIASTRDSLLQMLDGRTVTLESKIVILATAHAQIRETPMTFRLKILSFLADPNIAYILMLLGIYGLFFELYNPGAILPGIVGSISIIVAFFSLQLLPINWAGLLLILLAIILFLLEIKVTSYGMLAIGGVISMILGSIMLFEPLNTGVHVGLELIFSASIVTALFFLFIVGKGLQAQRRKIATGREALIGEIGTAFTALNPRGKIKIRGEIWDAVSEENLDVGDSTRVIAVSGLLLNVQKATK